MQTFFGPDFFTANRDKLRAVVGADTQIVLTGNGAMQRSGDEAFKFHQDSNFWYLTGLNGVDLTLVMTATDTYLIVPVLSFEREAFDGAHNVAAYAARSGITSIVYAQDGWQRLKGELAKQPVVATLASPPAFMKRHGVHTLPYRRRLITKLKRLNPKLTVRDIRPELATLRCIKQPEEIQAIQHAIDITTQTLQKVGTTEALAGITYEYQLEAAIGYQFRMQGSEGHAFPPIVGAGTHTTTLHHMDNDGPVAADDLIILDVGASVEHYSADIARTVSKRPITGRKADVYRAVAAAQDYAISLLKPGVQPFEYETAVQAFIGERLRKLGVITTNKREDIHRYFPHATSHFLGLDTHDTGDYRQPYAAGMIITCEPGIYLPEEGIGVRIEDDILITPDGCQVLSSACPRELTAVQ